MTAVYENIKKMSRFRKLGCWFRSMFTSPAFCLFDDTCFEGSTFSCDVLRNAPQGFTAATVHPHKATPLKGCDSYQPGRIEPNSKFLPLETIHMNCMGQTYKRFCKILSN